MRPTPVIASQWPSPEMLAEAEALGLRETPARVLALRAEQAGVPPHWLLDRSLASLDAPHGLPDIDIGADRLRAALDAGEVIGIETDHDVDGMTSHAVLYSALRDVGHPEEALRSYIGHRLHEGYGLSESVCERILADSPRPSLVITADNGSSDGPRIERLAQAGVETIVTDHHEMAVEGPPPALACINPTRPESRYPDPLIAGVGVAWLLLAAVRARLDTRRAGRIDLVGMLDFVALGTVADCVSLSRSRNNRIFVAQGLRRMNADQQRPAWLALREIMRATQRPLTAIDLAFGAGPRLNARGRLDEALAGVRFLLAETMAEAYSLAELLEAENTRRKAIEAELKEEAMAQAEVQWSEGARALVVRFDEGHPGVHGIVASRLVEAFGHPAVCVSPKVGDPHTLTGSLRGIQGMHVRDALQAVADAHPDLFIAFGGHEGAGGCTFAPEHFATFRSAYDAAVAEQLQGQTLQPIITTDGELPWRQITLDNALAVQALAPFGREFQEPTFEGTFNVRHLRAIGDGTHYRLALQPPGALGTMTALWFGIGEDVALAAGDRLRAVFSLSVDTWNGEEALRLIIRHGEPIAQTETP